MALKNRTSLNGKGLRPPSFKALSLALSLAAPVVGSSSGTEKQSSPSPQPTAEPYHVQVRTSYPDGEPRSTIVFLKGEKVLRTHGIQRGFAQDSGGASKGSGRSFFIFRRKEEYRLFVYERTGREILRTSGMHAVLSANGRFLVEEACPPPGGANAPRTFVLHDLSSHSERKIPVGSPGLPQAITDEGQRIVLWEHSPDPRQEAYFIVNEQGKTIWSKKGPYRLEGVSNKEKRVCFTNTKLRITEFCDLGTGAVLLKMPFAEFKLLHLNF